MTLPRRENRRGRWKEGWIKVKVKLLVCLIAYIPFYNIYYLIQRGDLLLIDGYFEHLYKYRGLRHYAGVNNHFSLSER